MLKDREELLEAETRKAALALEPEEVCEICGTAYTGPDGNAAHLTFKIHTAYEKIRARIAELKPRIEERERLKREKKDEELKKKRKEEWEAAEQKDKKGGKDADKDKDKDESDDGKEGKNGKEGKDSKEAK